MSRGYYQDAYYQPGGYSNYRNDRSYDYGDNKSYQSIVIEEGDDDEYSGSDQRDPSSRTSFDNQPYERDQNRRYDNSGYQSKATYSYGNTPYDTYDKKKQNSSKGYSYNDSTNHRLSTPYDNYKESLGDGYGYISNVRYDAHPVQEEDSETHSTSSVLGAYEVEAGSSDDSLDISEGEEIDDNLRNNKYKSKKRFHKGEAVTSWEVSYAVKKFRANIKKIMKIGKFNLRHVFRVLDVDNDSFISYIDFCKGLQKLSENFRIYFDLDDLDLLTSLYERLDEIEKKRKLSFNSFRVAIYKKKETREDIAALLKRIKLRVNQKDESQLKQAFQEFDSDKNGIISFQEFQKTLKKFDLPQEEIDGLFIYFERGENNIKYEEFHRLLFEDQMIQDNITVTMREYVMSLGKTLRQFFNEFSDPTTHLLSGDSYIKMLRQVGFQYHQSILEESFDFFDEDKNGAITFEEFEEAVNSNIVDRARSGDSEEKTQEKVKAIVKNMRSLAMSKGIDIAQKLNAIAEKNYNQISFTMFMQVLKESLVEIPYNEMEFIFFHFRNKTTEAFLDVNALVTAITGEKFDVEFIRERIASELKRFNITYAQLFAFFDSNSSGSICFTEFCELLEVVQIRLSKEDISTAFATFDINQDGNLSLEEFIRVLEGKPLTHNIDIQQVLLNMNQIESIQKRKTLRSLVGVKGTATPEASQSHENEKEKVIQFDDSSRFMNLNTNSINGKVIIHEYTNSMYLRRVEKMPEISKEFLKKDMANVIMYTVQNSGIDFFQEFVRADQERICVFLEQDSLKKVLNASNIFFSPEMLTYIFTYYSETDEESGVKYFPYLRFLMDIYNPLYLFKRVFIFQMHLNEVCLREMVSGIVKSKGENSKKIQEDYSLHVSSEELLSYCRRSLMYFSRDQFTFIWDKLNPELKTTIDIVDLAIGLEIPLNFNPSRVSGIELKLTQVQIEVINQFSIAVMKSARQRHVNIMDMFLYFDKECCLALTDSSQLQRIANILQIRMQPLEIRAIFTYLSTDQVLGQMPYMEIVKKSQLPEEYLKSILKVFLVMENWNLKQLFNKFAKNDSWNLPILREVIAFSQLKGIHNDVEASFHVWRNENNKYLTISDLSRILQVQETDTAIQISSAYDNSRYRNVRDLLNRVNILPQVNEKHYLAFYLNKPSDDLFLTKKVVLGEAVEVDFLSKRDQEEKRIQLEREKQVEEATLLLTSTVQMDRRSKRFSISQPGSPFNSPTNIPTAQKSKNRSSFSTMSQMVQSKKLYAVNKQ